jgi:hypothetical protein
MAVGPPAVDRGGQQSDHQCNHRSSPIFVRQLDAADENDNMSIAHILKLASPNFAGHDNNFAKSDT